MTSLSERFREVEVTVNGAAVVAEWPATWLGREASASVVRFVESQFQQERTMAEVRRVFGEVQQVSLNAMPLREIFVTLAKAGRKAA
jgi:hypothetical protein